MRKVNWKGGRNETNPKIVLPVIDPHVVVGNLKEERHPSFSFLITLTMSSLGHMDDEAEGRSNAC